MEENKRERINFGAALQAQGLELKGKNPDGSVRVFDPQAPETEREYNLDVRAALKAEGLDYDKVDLQYNDESTPISENKLGFLDQMDLMAAKKPKEKVDLLTKKFGKDNVKLVDSVDENGESTQFISVKGEDGVWSKADTGFLAGLVKDSPVIAGGVAGGIYGAKVGSLLGPKGTVLGLAVGGGIGAAMGRITDVASAEAAGIRTDSDAMDAAGEVGKEFVQSAVSALLMHGVGGAVVKGIKALGGSGYEILKNTAQTAAQMTRRNVSTFETLFDPANTSRVVSLKDKLISNEKSGKLGVDIATKIQIKEISNLLDKAKTNSFNQYESFKQLLKQNGDFEKVKVDMKPVLAEVRNIKAALFDDSAGTVSKSVDPTTLKKMGDIIQRIERATTSKNSERILKLQAGLEKTYNPTKRLRIQALIDKASSKSEIKNAVSFDAAEGLKRNIDEMLELSGHYAQGEHAISSTGRVMFQNLRNKILDQAGVSIKGTGAAPIWNKMRTEYSAFRKVYDDFAITGKRFVNNERAAQTINKMMGDKGDFLTEGLVKISDLAGDAGMKSYNTIRIAAAAKDLTPLYSINKGGPAQPLMNLATLGATSPRATGTHLAIKKITDGTVGTLNAMGKGVDFFTKLDPKSRMSLIQSPELYKKVFPDFNQMLQELNSESQGGM